MSETATTAKQPRVFISYSWTSPDQGKQILEWAEKLVLDGVDVILDNGI